MFGENQYILNTLEKDQTVNSDEALMEIFQNFVKVSMLRSMA